MRFLKTRPVGTLLAALNVALFATLVATRPPDYAALAGEGGVFDHFEEVHFAGRTFPIGPMHASPGDRSGLYMLLNVPGHLTASVATLLLEPLQPWGRAGASWLRAFFFALASAAQWVVVGSVVDAAWRLARRPAA